VWFPRFFDPNFDDREFIYQLMTREPPRECARCKSKYWNKEPVRKTQYTIAKTGTKIDKYREDDKLELFGHDMLTRKRLLAQKAKIDKAKHDLEMSQNQFNELMKKLGVVR